MTEEITMSSYHWLKNSPGTFFQEFDTICEKIIPNFYVHYIMTHSEQTDRFLQDVLETDAKNLRLIKWSFYDNF